MADPKGQIIISGAGLVGSLISIYLAQRGYKVDVFERRPDMRKVELDGGRSINLALSNRGWMPMEEVGVASEIQKIIIPMKGRLMHDEHGELSFQPYGIRDQAINSVSRAGLNMCLMDRAEAEGVVFHFEHKTLDVDFENSILTLEAGNKTVIRLADMIIGADGAFSPIRNAFQKTDRFNYSQLYIEHGYKELTITPDSDGGFRLEKNALHIWPRGNFMLIALPNLDASFTCTLFFPFEGSPSFAELTDKESVSNFFNRTFPDAVPHLINLETEYFNNPTSSLVTIKCFPWVKGRTLLIGDASHAIVPFFGQGMNSGFEDCRILNQLLDQHNDDWNKVLPEFETSRKPDVDAISDLALANFIEMRDLVADDRFLLRKEIESEIHRQFPDRWIPLYSMVTFNEHIPYSKAKKLGAIQADIMNGVMEEVDENWANTLNLEQIVIEFESRLKR